jgi:hypothetical protein
MRSEAREAVDDANQAGFFDADRSNRCNWLTKPWHAVTSRSAQRRREGVIKKAIAALELVGGGRRISEAGTDRGSSRLEEPL